MLTIEIYSDLICPWCFIGKRRLDRVLAELDVAASIRWRAYQLRPGLPAEGIDRRHFLEQRYGAGADPARLPPRLAEEAAVEQVDFAYERVERIPNTLLGHRLLAAVGAALDAERQHALAETLFVAYFQRGLDVGDRSTLLALAEQAGIERAFATAALDDARWAEQVQQELAAAQEHDVSGVPTLIFGGRFPLPGVQEDAVLRHFVERAAQRLAAG